MTLNVFYMLLSNLRVKKAWTQVFSCFKYFNIGFVCKYNSCTIDKIVYIFYIVQINVIIIKKETNNIGPKRLTILGQNTHNIGPKDSQYWAKRLTILGQKTHNIGPK